MRGRDYGRETEKEAIWSKWAERLVSLPGFPLWKADRVGGLLVDAFPIIPPWESKDEVRLQLEMRARARASLREIIEERFGIILP